MAIAKLQEGQSPFGTQAVPAALPVGEPGLAASVAPAVQGYVPPEINWKDEHTKIVEMFEASEDASRTNREKAERDRDYFDGKQWTDAEVKKLNKRGQPAIAKNRIKRKIRYLQGLEQQKRTDPRALPRTPKHDFDAQDITDALRFVTGANRYDRIRSDAFKDLSIAGWGGVSIRVEMKPGAANPRIKLEANRWDRMFFDPYSSAVDFSDASYLGEVRWMDKQDAIREYGAGAGKVFDETVSSAQVGGTFDDKPKNYTWVSYDKRYRVRVVKMYYIGADGVWQFAEFTKGGFLKAGPSPYLDDDGNPEHEYAWRSYEVDRDNNRYGEVRGMIDTQDEINKRASKLLHLVSVRQTFGNHQATGDQSTLDRRRELAKPDGHIDIGGAEWGKDFGIIPTTDLAQGQMELLKLNLEESDLEGPNAAMLGQGPQSASGRAVLANQAGGALEANPTFDTLQDMDHEVYRKIWRRIRQFWTAEEWIRVTDEDRNIRWVGLNTPAMQEAIDPMTGQPIQVPVIDPATGQPVLQNELASLEIDIIIDDAPNVGTMQQEEFGMLAQAANSPIGQLPSYPKMLIRASSFRDKNEMLADLQKAEEAAAQQGNPAEAAAKAELEFEAAKAQQQAQIEQQNMQAQIEIKRQELMLDAEAERVKNEQQMSFRAQEHAQKMQFAREQFELEQAARASAARHQAERPEARH